MFIVTWYNTVFIFFLNELNDDEMVAAKWQQGRIFNYKEQEQFQ